MRATVIADASFCSRTGAAGWAAWIAYDGGMKGQHSGVFRSNPSGSSAAELLAVLCAIWHAHKGGAQEILVQTDCLAVVHAVNLQNRMAQTFLTAKANHFPGARVRAKHVKGHTQTTDSRSWCNRWCDAEAKRQMRAQRNGQAIVSGQLHPSEKDRSGD